MKIENVRWQRLLQPFHAINFSRPKASEPKAAEAARHIPRKELEAIMDGALAATRELMELAKTAKSRLGNNRPSAQDDVLELLRMLRDAQTRINLRMEADLAKSTDTRDTEWNNEFYHLYIMPVSRMAGSPQAIVDRTLAASSNGAKNIKLLYDLVVAEIDVAIARFNVTLSLIRMGRLL